MSQLFTEIEQLLTFTRNSKKPKLIKDAAIYVEKGIILWIGKKSEALKKYRSAKRVALNVKTLLPAFIDCHTHTVFAGHRQDEFELRNSGVSYQQIANKGGGIAKTVKATRKASLQELVHLAEERSKNFIEQGVTTVEIKSGYGLDKKTELKMLEAIHKIKSVRAIPTFLGLHSIPKNKTSEKYLQEVLGWLPEVNKLCQRADIFIEKGYFTPRQAQAFFEALEQYNFDIVAHVEQLSQSYGVEVALKYKALSVDHFVKANASQVSKIAKSHTVAVALPISDFYLNIAYPPARQIIDAGGDLALATDYNPGSSPSQSVNFLGVLARLNMQMSLDEVLKGLTLNAAKALGLENWLGSLEAGKAADFVGFDCEYDQLFYEVGFHPVSCVYSSGKLSFKNRNT